MSVSMGLTKCFSSELGVSGVGVRDQKRGNR